MCFPYLLVSLTCLPSLQPDYRLTVDRPLADKARSQLLLALLWALLVASVCVAFAGRVSTLYCALPAVCNCAWRLHLGICPLLPHAASLRAAARGALGFNRPVVQGKSVLCPLLNCLCDTAWLLPSCCAAAPCAPGRVQQYHRLQHQGGRPAVCDAPHPSGGRRWVQAAREQSMCW